MKLIEKDRTVWLNDKVCYHRDGDLPSIIYNDGTKTWFKDGVLHRLNGPAIIYSNGVKEYWINCRRVYPKVSKRLFFRKKEILFLK